MWWNSGPHLKKSMKVERGEILQRDVKSYFREMTGIDEFKEVLQHKFGTIARAWRMAFDEDDNGLIDAREFVSACRQISFVGNMRSLWNNLDIDQSGFITLAELDVEAAQAFEKFRVRCVQNFGTMQAAWDRCLDCNRSGAMSLHEMREALPCLGYNDRQEVADLFELLRMIPGAFAIPAHDVLFLQKWEDRKQVSVSRGWRLQPKWTNLDPYFNEGTVLGEHERSLVSKRAAQRAAVAKSVLPKLQSFRSSSKSAVPASFTNIGVVPTTEDDAKSEYSDVVAVDQESAWEAFRQFLVDRYGSLPRAFDAMDASDDGYLSRQEFMNCVNRKERYCRASEAARLFDSAVSDKEMGVIKWADFGITADDMRYYLHSKQMQAQKTFCDRQVQIKSLRGEKAIGDHSLRLKRPGRKPLHAFWTELSKGWGLPPSYEPPPAKPLCPPRDDVVPVVPRPPTAPFR